LYLGFWIVEETLCHSVDRSENQPKALAAWAGLTEFCEDWRASFSASSLVASGAASQRQDAARIIFSRGWTFETLELGRFQPLCEPSQKGEFFVLPQPQAQMGPSFSMVTTLGALPDPLWEPSQ